MKKNHYKYQLFKRVYGKRQTKWEFLKYEVWRFNIDYSKTIAKKGKQRSVNLELKLKYLENNLKSEENWKLYNHCKNDLETFFWLYCR